MPLPTTSYLRPCVLAAFILSFTVALLIAQSESRIPPKVDRPVPQDSIDFIKFSILPYAQTAFCPFDEIQAWNCTTCNRGSKGTTNISTFGGTAFSASGYTAVNPQTRTIIIAFRGTSSLDTWISDLLIAKPDYDLPSAPPGTKVHYGFLSLWNQVREQVIERVHDLMELYPEQDANLLFTGHSLGGALATIASVDVFQHLSDQISTSQVALLTFAQPRVGNSVFSTWLNSLAFGRAVRVTNQDDWTPHLPPLFSGFKHYDDEWWIGDSHGTTIVCREDGGDVGDGGGDEEEEGGSKESRVKVQDDKVQNVNVYLKEQGVGFSGWPWWRRRPRKDWEGGNDGNGEAGDKNEPECKDRTKWKYSVSKHGFVWDEPIGFHVCILPSDQQSTK